MKPVLYSAKANPDVTRPMGTSSKGITVNLVRKIVVFSSRVRLMTWNSLSSPDEP